MDALRAAAMPANPLLDLVGARMAGASRTARGLAASAKPQAANAESVGAQFEGLFVSLLLKEMRQSLEPGSMFGEGGGDVLGGLFDSYLGEHLAKSGGLGIASMVNKQLLPARNTGNHG